MEKQISTIKKNALEEIHVGLSEFKGHNLIGIRVYVEEEDGKERIATKKGITCNVRLLPELREALEQAEVTAREAGLLK